MWLFLANKPLGIVHWHAEIRRKLQILYTECSKKLTHIVTFSAPNVLNPLPSLNMHLIIKNALLRDQKFLNWRDLSIFKNAVLVLSSTTVPCLGNSAASWPYQNGMKSFFNSHTYFYAITQIVTKKTNNYYTYPFSLYAKGIIFKIIQPHYSWRRKCSRSRISTFAILRINEMS